MIRDAPNELKAALIDVKVMPRAGRTAIAGTRDNALLIRLAAAPVEGEANAELIAFLARRLGVPQRHLSLVAGEKSRNKRIKIVGLSAVDVEQRLGPVGE